ncbi:serine/threonine-protein phosphatase [Saccharothrix syringae]|uniref:Serine/threonine-protein phosphatase n=1 Tax=Saccharothrix syringae TaxID=103733 RepID=A0A5Q0HEU1_SACSY|nr:serine/threonine-protein phosphatase [Saccharothrix syringae]
MVQQIGVDDGTGWLSAPTPALVAEADGSVRALNDAARSLFPTAAVGGSLAAGFPSWLAHAHTEFTVRSGPAAQPVQGPVERRSFEAHPVGRDRGAVMWWLVEDTDVRVAREALGVERERTALLARMSSALSTSLHPERCMEVTARLAADHLADAAVVIAPGRQDEYPVAHCVRDGAVAHARLAFDPYDVPGLGEALQGFPPVPSHWLDPSSAPTWLLPADFGEVASIVVTPLPGHGVPAGALVLLRGPGRQSFTEHEETFARLFAARAGAAISAARMFAQQGAITDVLVRDLLPPTLRQLGGVEYAGRYRASVDTERIGGDFYDVHPVPGGEDEALAVLGDVCGKGLEAAVLTGKVRTTLQALLPLAADHQRVLRLLNNALLSTHDSRFVTLVLASVRRVGAHVRLRLTSGGHLPPLVVRATGEVHEVATSGTLVGVLPEITSTTAEVVLAPGETCLLYTDGITEALGGPMGDEMFGEERLRAALADCAGMPADAIVEHVHMLASQWVGSGEHDDIAVLAVTAPRGRHLTAVDGHGRGRYTA